jgi:hypothetical protein
MFAANLDKSSQASFEHANPTNQSLLRPIVSYPVRTSVRKVVFLTGRGFHDRKRHMRLLMCARLLVIKKLIVGVCLDYLNSPSDSKARHD